MDREIIVEKLNHANIYLSLSNDQISMIADELSADIPDSFQWLIDFNENQDLDMAKNEVRWTTEECADMIDEYVKRNINNKS